MKTLLLILTVLSFNAQAQWYAELALGVTDQVTDQFQIPLDNPLGRISFGYETNNNFVIEFDHVSSIPNKNDLRGINTIWVSKKFILD